MSSQTEQTGAVIALQHLQAACQMLNADQDTNKVCGDSINAARQHCKALCNLMNSKDKSRPTAAIDFVNHAISHLEIVAKQKRYNKEMIKPDAWLLIQNATAELTQYKRSELT